MGKTTLQITYWTIGGFDGAKPVEQAMDEARSMGYDGLELAFGAGCLAPGVSEARCREIRRAAERRGIRVETLASGAYWQKPLSSPDPAVRKEAVAFTREYLQAAAWIGAKAVLVLPGVVAVPWDPKVPPVPYAAAWRNAASSLRALAPLAERLRVTIALENVWSWFLADPVAMRTFVDQFGSRRIGVYLDVGNTLLNGFPEHWIEILGRRIAAVHVKNFSRQDCGGTLHGFGDDLLQGDADWKAIVTALKRIRYAGPVTAEMLPFSRLPDLKLPDLALARDTAGKLRRIMAPLR
jgi:hexulose-6-phosphate isomerase